MSIITYPLDGPTYTAEDAATYLCTRTSGVYAKETNFAVRITGPRQLTVAPGLAWVNYDDFKGVSVCSRDDAALTVPDADTTLPRVDRIVLQFDTDANLTALKLKPGTPAAEPQPPAIVQNHRTYELGLATVSVPAGSAAVTSADLTDTRADETVCGVMRDGVTGIPTQQLVEQWQAAQAAQLADGTALLDRLRAEVAAGSAYSKQETDAKLDDLRTEVDTKLAGLYPVGSIYQSTDAASPAALFGGTWEQIASDRVLMGASSAHAAATTADAGLPNISGTFTAAQHSYYDADPTGAFSRTAERGSYGPNNDSYMRSWDIAFAASKSSAIYGKSDTVQPPAYYVYIWRRVA